MPVRRRAGPAKAQVTLSDPMARVRRPRGSGADVSTSSQEVDLMNMPRVLMERFTEAVCDAAQTNR